MSFPFSNFSFRSYPLVWNSTSPIRGYRCTVPLRYLDFKTVSDVYVCNVRECIHACVHVYLAITLLGISPLFWQEGNSLGENVALLSLREFTGFRTKKKILGEKFSILKLSVGNFYKAWNDRVASRGGKNRW